MEIFRFRHVSDIEKYKEVKRATLFLDASFCPKHNPSKIGELLNKIKAAPTLLKYYFLGKEDFFRKY